MGQMLIRRIRDDYKAVLQDKARREGTSLEEVARDLLHAAAVAELRQREGAGEATVGLGSRIARMVREADVELDEPLVRPPDEPPRTLWS